MARPKSIRVAEAPSQLGERLVTGHGVPSREVAVD